MNAQAHLNYSETEQRMASMGLVDIKQLDPSILVQLVYATADNFVGEVLYDDINKAFLRPEAAEAVVRAQQLLKKENPGYTLLVYDAARPMAVQKNMKDKVRGTSMDIYVSSPENGGGLHNYGMAVDITIADDSGAPLSMGTDFDFLGKESNIDKEQELVAKGKITESERLNRELLRKVMKGAGFMPLKTEWWHFNFCTRAYAKANLSLIE
ncbi:MAG: M15 family metallopeptidase [Rikenellaceae bacterium]|nr:M15 family metallopeptidase [Rikenellaceae bacterium]